MTILVATFTYGGDEEITRFNAQAIGTLRKLYPQHRIIHYLIDDANEPFKEPFKDEGDTHYIQSDFNRRKNMLGTEAFVGITQTMASLAKDVGADWVIKLDSDTILMSLDFIDERYSYIGSSRETEKKTNGWDGSKFYCWGACVAYKNSLLDKVANFIDDSGNLDNAVSTCRQYGWTIAEDVLTGHVIVNVLHEKHMIGNVDSDSNIFLFVHDSQKLNIKASCASCKGRYLQGIRNKYLHFVGDKEQLTPSSVIGRMQLAEEAIAQRLKIKRNQEKRTILITIFTYKEDEEITILNTEYVETLRKLYPQHKILLYIIDDSSNPFVHPMKDEGDTHYIQSKFDRQKNLSGAKAFIGITRTIDILARKTKADWVIKLDSDTILMSLDFIDDNYELIGSNGKNEKKFYGWGSCVAYKPQSIHDIRMFTRDEKNLNGVLEAFRKNNLNQGEDVLFGYILTQAMGKNALVGNLNEDGNMFIYIDDNRSLNPNASCAVCKGRYLHGLRSFSNIYVSDKELLTASSIINRMRQAHETMTARLS